MVMNKQINKYNRRNMNKTNDVISEVQGGFERDIGCAYQFLVTSKNV